MSGSRWVELAENFAAALDRVAAHRDVGQRAILIRDARRALQQFTAAGNLAIEGQELKEDAARSYRLPYRDD